MKHVSELNIASFADALRVCMQREAQGLGTLEENCDPLDEYRQKGLVDAELIEYVVNVIVGQVSHREEFQELLALVVTSPADSLVQNIKRFMDSVA